VIDAGHGGEDPGPWEKISREKDIVPQNSLKVGNILRRIARMSK